MALNITSAQDLAAQNILRVQGDKAFAEWPDQAPQIGEEFYAITTDGKRTAIGKVENSKGRRAILSLVRGKWVAGQTLGAKPIGATTSAAEKGSFSQSAYTGGVLLGYSMDSLSMTARGGSLELPVKMAGSTFSLKGVFDMNFGSMFVLRGLAGLDGFNVTGSVVSDFAPVCSDTTSCSINFTYLSLEGQALMKFNRTGKFQPFILGGYSFFSAMSAGKTTVSNFDATVKTNSAFVAGAGADLVVGPKMLLPLGVTYRSYQVASGVSASSIGIGTGILFLF